MIKTIRFSCCRVAFLWALLALLTGGRAWAQVANDDCASAVSLTASSVCSVPVNGTVAAATQSLPPTAACGFGLTSAIDVWYSFTATSTTHLVTLAPRFAAILEVRSGTCATSTSIFCTTVANNNTVGVPVGGLVSGQTYLISGVPQLQYAAFGASAARLPCALGKARRGRPTTTAPGPSACPSLPVPAPAT